MPSRWGLIWRRWHRHVSWKGYAQRTEEMERIPEGWAQDHNLNFRMSEPSSVYVQEELPRSGPCTTVTSRHGHLILSEELQFMVVSIKVALPRGCGRRGGGASLGTASSLAATSWKHIPTEHLCPSSTLQHLPVSEDVAALVTPQTNTFHITDTESKVSDCQGLTAEPGLCVQQTQLHEGG